MKKLLIFILFLLVQNNWAQTEIDTLVINAQDSSIVYSIELNEAIITNKDIYSLDVDRKKMVILKRRVFKVFPYARMTSEKLLQINKTMSLLKTNKEKKRYFKIVEKYLEEEFEPRLKKLSRKDGQILVKLIYRQTGNTTYELIKEYKSGWKAFWANTTAKMFDINLKENYKPYEVLEDYQIESILNVAFEQKKLIEQKPKEEIDYEKLNLFWKEKIIAQQKPVE